MRRFDDPAQFLRFMQGMPQRLRTAAHAGLTDGARIIQHEATAEIGHYQGEAGPFPAWEELDKDTKAQRVALGFTENDPLLRTGALRDHIDMTAGAEKATIGVPHEVVGDGSKANPIRDIGDVATYLELGTSHMPPRSFLGGAAVRKTSQAVDAAAGAVAAALAGLPPRRTPGAR